MATRHKIKCNSADDVAKFVNLIQTFEGDINLKVNETTYDAKSLIVVNALSTGREVEIELVHDNEIDKFKKFLLNFEE